MRAQSLSHVWLFATPWTAACQAPSFMWFTRQEYWSELPSPSPGDLPSPGREPTFPAPAGRFFTTEPPGKPITLYKRLFFLPLGLGMFPFMCWELCYPKVYGLHHPVMYFFFSVWPFPSSCLPLNLIYLRARLVDALWSFSCNGLSHSEIYRLNTNIFNIDTHT